MGREREMIGFIVSIACIMVLASGVGGSISEVACGVILGLVVPSINSIIKGKK